MSIVGDKGNGPRMDMADDKPKAFGPLFGDKSGEKPSIFSKKEGGGLFGGQSKGSLFGDKKKDEVKTGIFCQNSEAKPQTGLFQKKNDQAESNKEAAGDNTNQSEPKKSIFGNTPASSSLFNKSTGSADPKPPIFGAGSSDKPKSSLFGGQKKETEGKPETNSTLFGTSSFGGGGLGKPSVFGNKEKAADTPAQPSAPTESTQKEPEKR